MAAWFPFVDVTCFFNLSLFEGNLHCAYSFGIISNSSVHPTTFVLAYIGDLGNKYPIMEFLGQINGI